jgi:hypothetical protein
LRIILELSRSILTPTKALDQWTFRLFGTQYKEPEGICQFPRDWHPARLLKNFS